MASVGTSGARGSLAGAGLAWGSGTANEALYASVCSGSAVSIAWSSPIRPCQSTAITYQIGTGASDLTLWSVPLTLSPRCDEIQDVCVPVANAGKSFTGALTGNYDVSGETKHYLNVRCQDANAIRETGRG